MQDRLLIYLEDIRLAVDDVIRFTNGLEKQTYLNDDLVRSAVERQLITAGEAMTQLAKQFPETAQKVADSREVIGFRNVLVHRYRELDHSKIYEIIRGKLPLLRDNVAALIDKLDKPE